MPIVATEATTKQQKRTAILVVTKIIAIKVVSGLAFAAVAKVGLDYLEDRFTTNED